MYLLVWIGLFAVNIAMIEGNGCSKPLSISNGHYKFISSPDWPQTICRVQYSCDLGYKMNGTGLRFCFHSHWVGKIPVCKEVTCNQLDAPANGSMEFVDNQAPANQMDSIVQFSCEDGYQLAGEAALVCLPDGEWSALPPTCASDQCDDTNACESNPCQNNGTCIDKLLGYTCNCVTGFTGDDCSIVPRLCSDIPSGRSGNYQIQPADDIQPFQVHCNFDTSPPSTEIGHDSEDEILVDGYQNQLSYTRNVVYQLSMQQIEAVTNAATTCKQHINYKCYHSKLMRYGSGYSSGPYAAWFNKDHQQMSYWGGTTTSGSCACGDTGTCANSSWKCNCDNNDNVWREDGGFIVDKTQLPVTIMKFGDTGGTGAGSQQGKHKLGKLVCV